MSELRSAHEQAESAFDGEAAGAEPAPAAADRGWAGIGDVVVVLGLCLVAWTLTYGFAKPGIMLAYGIAPEVVPRAVILLIAGLALLLLVPEIGWRHGPPRIHLHPRIPAVLAALAALIVYAMSFEPLGAFTLMPLFCVAVSRAFAPRPFWKLLGYGVAVTVGSWILFVLLLRAPLPGSRLPFL